MRLKKSMTMDMAMMDASNKKRVLIVDDNAQLCRLLARRLFPFFDEVFFTEDPGEATRILERKAITHILCDLDLGAGEGPGDATGFAFIELWRLEFPGIERAVVFTGTDVSGLARPEAVDAVLSKTESIRAVVEALIGGDSSWRK